MRLRILNLLLRLCVWPALRFGHSPALAAQIFEIVAPRLFPGPPFNCHLTERLDGMTLHWVRVGSTDQRRIVLFLHGGAYLSGSGRAYHGLLGHLSRYTGLPVCAPDYRLLQHAPFPAAFDDALRTWDELLARGYHPSDIVLGGDSAGGGLMLALLAELTQRGTPPRAAFAMSPWTDLTLQGASLQSKQEVVLPAARMQEVVHRYLRDAAPDDPRASPLFARFNAPPPVLIQVGDGEALLNDAQRMADALGPAADLRVWPHVPHVWPIFHGYIPQAAAAFQEIATFVQASFAMDKR